MPNTEKSTVGKNKLGAKVQVNCLQKRKKISTLWKNITESRVFTIVITMSRILPKMTKHVMKPEIIMLINGL